MDQVRHVDTGDLDHAARGGDLNEQDPPMSPVALATTKIEDSP